MVGFTKEAIAASRIARSTNAKLRKQSKIDEYLKSPIRCGNEKCNNVLTYTQAADKLRFCCRSCSNSVLPRRIKFEKSPETKTRLQKPKPLGKYKCTVCATMFEFIRPRKVCSTTCLNTVKAQSARKAAATMSARGTHSGWHNRRFEPSYPERYFISVFENEGVEGWEREKKVGRWFIDFAFPSKMLAVEIDGRQHEDADRKKRDEEKDKYLVDAGWKVTRIKWRNPKTEKGKQFLHPQVKMLLEEIRNQPTTGNVPVIMLDRAA